MTQNQAKVELKKRSSDEDPCLVLIDLIQSKIMSSEYVKKGTMEKLFNSRSSVQRRLVPYMQTYDIMANEKYSGLNNLMTCLDLHKDE